MVPCTKHSNEFIAKWKTLANLEGKFCLKKHSFNIPVWEKSMRKAPRLLRNTIGHFLCHGFDIIIEDKISEYKSKNLPSAYGSEEMKIFITEYLTDQIIAGKIAGPFFRPISEVLGEKCWDVPIGTVPKDHTFRLIEHYSYPRKSGNSINACIPTRNKKIVFPSFRKIVRQMDSARFCGKVDLEAAYRQCSIHRNAFHLTGKRWFGLTFFDGFLPFGLASAPRDFSIMCRSFIWILVHKYHQVFARSEITPADLEREFCIDDVMDFLLLDRFLMFIDSLLDDIWFFGRTKQEAENMLKIILREADILGIKLKASKICRPSSIMIVLGIQYNFVTKRIHLGNQRILKLSKFIDTYLAKRVWTRREVKCLLGKLNFVLNAVKYARMP